MTREYRMTSNGTLHSVEDLRGERSYLVNDKIWPQLTPVFVEDKDFMKTQLRLWMIYDDVKINAPIWNIE